ncbi:hypothetical protein HK104_008259 [Borealophlyctis nickersoniae]|nr:hypothetical protein HK104_008259 [Borealophlyctis nickersoniae]
MPSADMSGLGFMGYGMMEDRDWWADANDLAEATSPALSSLSAFSSDPSSGDESSDGVVADPSALVGLPSSLSHDWTWLEQSADYNAMPDKRPVMDFVNMGGGQVGSTADGPVVQEDGWDREEQERQLALFNAAVVSTLAMVAGNPDAAFNPAMTTAAASFAQTLLLQQGEQRQEQVQQQQQQQQQPFPNVQTPDVFQEMKPSTAGVGDQVPVVQQQQQEPAQQQQQQPEVPQSGKTPETAPEDTGTGAVLTKAEKKRIRESTRNITCHNCGTDKTPLWRRTADRKHSLCNACGLYYKQYQTHRPANIRHKASQSKATPTLATTSTLAKLALFKPHEFTFKPVLNIHSPPASTATAAEQDMTTAAGKAPTKRRRDSEDRTAYSRRRKVVVDHGAFGERVKSLSRFEAEMWLGALESQVDLLREHLRRTAGGCEDGGDGVVVV